MPAGTFVPLALPELTVTVGEPAHAGLLARSVYLAPANGPAPWQDGAALALAIPNATNDGPVATVEDVVAAVEAAADIVERLPGESLLGVEATVLRYESTEAHRLLRTTTVTPPHPDEEEGHGWLFLEGQGTMWILELGDAVLVADAYTLSDADADADAIVTFARDVLAQLSANPPEPR